MRIQYETVAISKQVLAAKKRQSDLLRQLDYLESEVKKDFDYVKVIV